MKKSFAALMAVVCLAFFVGDAITSQAAVNATSKPCETCGATMIQHGEHIDHGSGSHLVDTGFRVGNEPIMEICKWGYSVDRTYYTCPSGHATIYVDAREEYHSSSYCPSNKK